MLKACRGLFGIEIMLELSEEQMRGLKYVEQEKKYIYAVHRGVGGRGEGQMFEERKEFFFPSVDMDDFRYDIGFHICIDKYMCDNIYFCIGMFATCVSTKDIFIVWSGQ